MSEKDKRTQPPGLLRSTGGSSRASEPTGDASNAMMATQLAQAKRGTVVMPLGGVLNLPDVESLPTVSGAGTGGVDRYNTWMTAVKSLRAYEEQHMDDPFSYGRPEAIRERYQLQEAAQQSFNAMSPEEQQIVVDSEVRFAKWKDEFDAKCMAEDKEKRRVWMYEYAGLDPSKPVDAATLQQAFEQAQAEKSRASVHDNITAIPNMIGDEFQDAANGLYRETHISKTGQEGWLDGAAKSLWNLGVDGVHMIGHGAGSLTKTGGEMAGGAAAVAMDPQGAASRFVTEKETSRKNIQQTLTDGGASGGMLTQAHAAILSYTPGVQNIGEGLSNASLESPATTEAWKNRSAQDRIVQTAGGISEFAGTLAGVGSVATKAKSLLKPKPGNAPGPVKAAKTLDSPEANIANRGSRGVTPTDQSGRFWEADDFMGGKMDDATAQAIRKELEDEIATMNLSPAEIEARGMQRGLTGLNNAPEEWLPKYKKGNTNTEAYGDVWGTTKNTSSRSAPEAATKKLDEYRGRMTRGETPTGKLHWSQYGDTPESAVHALRRLAKTYSLLEGKAIKGNASARARSAIFDTLADWAEKTEGLRH